MHVGLIYVNGLILNTLHWKETETEIPRVTEVLKIKK